MKDFPTQEQILDFIRAHPNASGKREIGRAFGIKGNARIELKRVQIGRASCRERV